MRLHSIEGCRILLHESQLNQLGIMSLGVYDASNGAYLQEAWDTVKAKPLFWDGGNIFIMILSGNALAIK